MAILGKMRGLLCLISDVFVFFFALRLYILFLIAGMRLFYCDVSQILYRKEGRCFAATLHALLYSGHGAVLLRCFTNLVRKGEMLFCCELVQI